MRKSRFSEEQIVGLLKEAEAGAPVKEFCRRIGISEATFDRWKGKCRRLEVNEARRLRQLEEESGRLKKPVAQQALDLDALKAALSKKVVGPQAKRAAVRVAREQSAISNQRACGPVAFELRAGIRSAACK